MAVPFALPEPYDFWRSTRGVGPVARREGRVGLWWATHTPEGPATLHLRHVEARRVDADAWGPGSGWVLAQVPRVLGLEDHTADSFAPPPGPIAELVRRFPGFRLARTDRVYETLVAAVLGQKVQSDAARQSLGRIRRRFGELAPGPIDDLWMVPTPRRMASLDSSDLHPCNVERSRAERILTVARRAKWCEARTAAAELELLPGIGPWTAAVVAQAAWGDPDAPIVGDYHLPNTVAWALAGEHRGDDARMLELLEPYRPHRTRAVLALTNAQIHAPRRGPRLAISDIRRL